MMERSKEKKEQKKRIVPIWVCILNSHARTLGTTINETVQAIGY